MLATISGMHSTVPVTSLSAYIRRSAGASSLVWPIIEVPTSRTIRSKRLALSVTL